MNITWTTGCIAFEGTSRLAEGPLHEVAVVAKRALDRLPAQPILIFDSTSSEQIDLNFQGSEDDVLSRVRSFGGSDTATSSDRDIPSAAARTPGRPKLGVMPREVTLLPRHWDWLASQPGGASATLRKLVEHALRTGHGASQVRGVRDATYRFILAVAGNEPGFEDASRALFGTNPEGFLAAIKTWPDDIRQHAVDLAAPLLNPEVTL